MQTLDEGQTQPHEEEKSTNQSEQENDKKSFTKDEEKMASVENLNEGQGIVLEDRK